MRLMSFADSYRLQVVDGTGASVPVARVPVQINPQYAIIRFISCLLILDVWCFQPHQAEHEEDFAPVVDLVLKHVPDDPAH